MGLGLRFAEDNAAEEGDCGGEGEEREAVEDSVVKAWWGWKMICGSSMAKQAGVWKRA